MPDLINKVVIPSGDTKLTVTVHSRPASETVILLHGGPGVPDEMTEVREFLSGFMQVITFDQRGINSVSNGSCTYKMSDYIMDINSICEYLKIEKFHLFGHSWGGLYAQLYAKDNADKILSLFLCSPASGTGKIWSMTEKEIFNFNYRQSTFFEWIGMGINAFFGLMGSKSAYRKLFEQIIINYHKGYNVDPPDDEKLAGISHRAGIMTRSEIKKYPEIGIFGITPYPVIITFGQYDAYGKSREYTLRRFPRARKEIIPDSGHTPWKHNWPYFKILLSSFYNSGGK